MLTALNQTQFPFSFLIALGVLHILTRQLNSHSITLRWARDDHTDLWTTIIEGVSPEQISDTLVQAATEATATHPLWSGNIPISKMPIQSLRELLRPHAWDIFPMQSWASVLTEWPENAETPKNPKAKTSQLHLLSGGQAHQFLLMIQASIRFITTHQSPSTPLSEALWGPWRHADILTLSKGSKGFSESSLGWSTRALANGAKTDALPENIQKTVTAATIWLAAEGLAFFPTWNQGQDAITAAIHFQRRHGTQWIFPLWTDALSATAVYHLLIGFTIENFSAWQRRGVTDAFCAQAISELSSNRSTHYTYAFPAITSNRSRHISTRSQQNHSQGSPSSRLQTFRISQGHFPRPLTQSPKHNPAH